MKLKIAPSQDNTRIDFKTRNGAVFGISTTLAPDACVNNVKRNLFFYGLMAKYGIEKAIFMEPNNGKISQQRHYYLKQGITTVRADSIVVSNKNVYGAFIHAGHPQLIDCHIIRRTLDKLLDASCLAPDDFGAVVYSGICTTCFEVRDDFIQRLYRSKVGRQKLMGVKTLEIKRTKSKRTEFEPCETILENLHQLYYEKPGVPFLYNFSLLEFIKRLLAHHGIELEDLDANGTNRFEQIDTIELCPRCSTWAQFGVQNKHLYHPLYSYRRGDIERNLVYALIPGSDTMLFSWTGDCPYILIY